MKNTTGPTKNWRDESLALAESLVESLDKIHQCVRATHSWPGLVELEQARKNAMRIRALISNEQPISAARWHDVVRGMAFLLDIAQKIHSLLNCMLFLVEYYDYWACNKIVANCGRYVSDTAGREIGRYQSVSLAGGEWQKKRCSTLAA